MRQVLIALRVYGVKLAMVSAAMLVSTPTPSLADDLPPCAVGRIVNFGLLSLSGCAISDNSTQDPGGGVENYGTLELTNVVISGNRGAGGGGIYNSGSLTLTNVIVSGNTSDGPGGGIFNDGGAVFMSNVTIAGNKAGAGGGGLANLSGGSAIGVNIALVGNETVAGNGGGILNDASLCLSAGDFNTCFDQPTGGSSLVRDNHAARNGGGIANLGSIAVSDSTVDRNVAEGGNGGGVWNGGGTTQLANVTISTNTTTGDGGGLYNEGLGAVCCATRGTDYVTNITLADNRADGNGGGVSTHGSAYTGLASATIADNLAGGSGGGVYNDDESYGFTELKDTLLARNGQNCAGDVYSAGHNLDTGLTCSLSAPGDKTDVQVGQVGLNALAANGGPAQGSAVVFDAMRTLALDPASPAVDAGSESCPAADQRGVTRPQIAACDIGAFELEPVETATVTATVTAASRMYDTTTNATLTACTLTGVQPQDDVSCVASDGRFDSANVGTGKSVTASVSLTGAASGHYQLSSGSAMAVADIMPALAVVTPHDDGKTYRTADPVLTGVISGFLAADGVTARYSRIPGESVATGPYAISATLSPAGALANYAVTYNTASLTITKASAAVTPNAASKVYGNPDPALTGTLSGFLAADGVSATYSRTPGETVAGSPYTISAVLSPAGALANYNISYNTAPFTITGTPPPSPGVTNGDTATIGFWHNKNGQATLNCLNGGPNSIALGNYLASTYPSLFGTGTGSFGNLANKKNSEIATIYLSATYFGASGQKANAQTIAVAFATYVTSSSLSGGTNCGAGFGFTFGVGTGTKTYYVGSLGAAIGLSNDRSYTVFQLLQAAATQRAAGAFNANAFNTIFDTINRSGDII